MNAKHYEDRLAKIVDAENLRPYVGRRWCRYVVLHLLDYRYCHRLGHVCDMHSGQMR